MLILLLIVVGTPAVFQSLQTICSGTECINNPQFSPQQLQELKGMGLSLTFFASYLLAFQLLFGIGVCAQIYRYMCVSNQMQKQQTKWVLYGFSVAIAEFLALNALGALTFFVPLLQSLWQHTRLLIFFIQPAYFVCVASILVPVV